MKLNVAFWVLLALFVVLVVHRLAQVGVAPRVLLLETVFDPITWASLVVGYFWQRRRKSGVSEHRAGSGESTPAPSEGREP